MQIITTMRSDITMPGVAATDIVAVDLGGTKLLAGVIDGCGSLRSRVTYTTHDLRGRPSDLLDRIADAIRSAVSMAGGAAYRSVGVGVAGALDRSKTVVDVAPNLGWQSVAIAPELSRRLDGAAVFVENDGRAAALAEHRFGAGKGRASLLAVFVGTGVGGAIVHADDLHEGAHGGAGKIGHVIIRAGGARCPCGRRGCLEALVARDALARHAARLVARGQRTVLTSMVGDDLRSLTSRELAVALAQNDPVAIRIARRSARYVGLAIGSALNLLEPDVVVLGGGVAQAGGTRYMAWVTQAARSQVVSTRARMTSIVPAALGDDAGLVGAALVARRGLARHDAGNALP